MSRRDENADGTVTEAVQRLLAGVLRFVAMDDGGIEAIAPSRSRVLTRFAPCFVRAKMITEFISRIGKHRREDLALLFCAAP